MYDRRFNFSQLSVLLFVCTRQMHDLLKFEEGVRALGAKFNACEPMVNGKDYSVFETAVTSQFADSAQYNHQVRDVAERDACSYV